MKKGQKLEKYYVKGVVAGEREKKLCTEIVFYQKNSVGKINVACLTYLVLMTLNSRVKDTKKKSSVITFDGHNFNQFFMLGLIH